MAKNMDILDGDCLIESYCVFSFIHLTNIYSHPGTRSMMVSKILSQQGNTQTHTHRKYTFSTGVFSCLLAIFYQLQITEKFYYYENSN